MDGTIRHPLDYIEATIAITSRLQRHILEDRVADLGLNFSQSLVIQYLAYCREVNAQSRNQTEIAEELKFRKPATGAALDVLSARGFVSKVAGREDRRSLIVDITDDGFDVAREITRRFAEVSAGIEDGISPAEMVAFRATFAKIGTNIERMTSSDEIVAYPVDDGSRASASLRS